MQSNQHDTWSRLPILWPAYDVCSNHGSRTDYTWRMTEILQCWLAHVSLSLCKLYYFSIESAPSLSILVTWPKFPLVDPCYICVECSLVIDIITFGLINIINIYIWCSCLLNTAAKLRKVPFGCFSMDMAQGGYK